MEGNTWDQRRGSRQTRRRVLRGAFAAAVSGAGLALMGCGGGGDKSSTSSNTGAGTSAPAAGATQAPKAASFNANGTFRVAIPADRGSLDPQEVGGVSNYYNGGSHFNSLFTVEPTTNEVVPHMASYQWVDNNTALMVKLRDGITSHDGQPYDSEVLKWSLERVGQRGEYSDRKDWTSGRKSFVDPLGEFRVVDKLTLRLEVKKPDVSIPANFTSVIYMVPKAYIKQVGDKEFSAKPLGMGPYKFVSRIPDTEVKSTRNDSYFEENTAKYGPWKPWYKDLVHLIRPEPLSMVAGLEAKEIDFVPDLDVDQAKQFDGKKGYTVLWTSTGLGHGIQWDTHLKTDPKTGKPNPFLDKRVRIAANLAVNRDAYIK
jgi:peptide/nickel transport system substrate-binding protein